MARAKTNARAGDVELGSTENRVLLAIRGGNGPESALNIKAWMPLKDLGAISFAIYRLKQKELIEVVSVVRGTSFYDLTEAGRALVHPKTGPLNRKHIAAATVTAHGRA